MKKGTGDILGTTIVARHAGEMISEVTLAMTADVGPKDVARTIHPYPTQAHIDRPLLAKVEPTTPKKATWVLNSAL